MRGGLCFPVVNFAVATPLLAARAKVTHNQCAVSLNPLNLRVALFAGRQQPIARASTPCLHTETDTDTDTDADKDTDTDTHRHTDTQTHMHTHARARTQTQIQT